MILGLLWPKAFEWYLNVFLNDILNDILDSLYRGIGCYFKLPLRVPLSPVEISLNGPMALNDTEWYLIVINGIPFAPFKGLFDNKGVHLFCCIIVSQYFFVIGKR